MELIPDNINFKQYLSESEGTEKVVPASTFIDDVVDRIYGEVQNNSPHTPWGKLGDNYQMRPGEVSLWAGINGHGKTLVTSHIALHLLLQNQKTCIASFEMKGAATMARMVKQAAGSGEPSVDYIKRFHKWTDDLLWIYDQQGVCDPQTLRGVMMYAADELGVTQFFVDSVMKVIKGDDDYNGQKDFVNEVCAIAQDTGMHVHLIAHVKKMGDELTIPNKFDVKGSSSMSDLVDNAAIIWRNRIKEKRLSDPKITPEDFEEAKKLPDAVINFVKQRHFDWEGKIALWLAAGAHSFNDEWGQKPYFWNPPKRQSKKPQLVVREDSHYDEDWVEEIETY